MPFKFLSCLCVQDTDRADERSMVAKPNETTLQVIHWVQQPDVKVKKFPSHYDPSIVYECPICLDDIKHDDKLVTSCHHVFHRRCILAWNAIKKECPICRHDDSVNE